MLQYSIDESTVQSGVLFHSDTLFPPLFGFTEIFLLHCNEFFGCNCVDCSNLWLAPQAFIR